MARFEYTRTIEHYTFTPPRFISREDYEQLKKQIEKHPKLPLVDEENVEKSHGRLSAVLFIGILALVIGLFVAFSSDEPPGWAILLIMGSIFGVLHPLMNMGTFQSSQNKVEAERQRIAFYRRLKEFISTSRDYNEFRETYEKSYGYRR
jgi:hypothetical protein